MSIEYPSDILTYVSTFISNKNALALPLVSHQFYVIFKYISFREYKLDNLSDKLDWDRLILNSHYIESLRISRFDFFFMIPLNYIRLVHLHLENCEINSFDTLSPTLQTLNIVDCIMTKGLSLNLPLFPELKSANICVRGIWQPLYTNSTYIF